VPAVRVIGASVVFLRIGRMLNGSLRRSQLLVTHLQSAPMLEKIFSYMLSGVKTQSFLLSSF
jgi:hypothetical protein